MSSSSDSYLFDNETCSTNDPNVMYLVQGNIEIHSRSFYGLGPVSKSLHGQPHVLGNTPYSKLTAASHGFPAIARLSWSTCFVLSIRNKHSNEINCRRVDRLMSPSWFSPSWFVADLTVAETACRRDDWWPLGNHRTQKWPISPQATYCFANKQRSATRLIAGSICWDSKTSQ